MSFLWNYIRMRNISLNKSFHFPEKEVVETIEPKDDFTFIVYTFILPIICVFGIFGNVMTVLVLMRMKIRCSSYTYLNVKTASDLVVCFLLLLSVVVHGFLYKMDGEDFDLLITLPIASIFSGIIVSATAGVTIDRLLLLRNPSRPTKPAMCCPQIARRIMMASIFASIVINFPYFFIFTTREDGFLHPTKFFNSCLYIVYNWIRFFIYGISPCVILPIATALLIISIKRVSNQIQHLSCKSQAACLDSTRLTITLIAMAIFFLIGEVPGHIISKKAAFVFLYNGDASTVITDDSDLGVFREVSMILSSINCSINFFVFYMLHPPFGKGLKELFSKKKKVLENNQVLVNVYVISKEKVDVNRFRNFIRNFQELQMFIYR